MWKSCEAILNTKGLSAYLTHPGYLLTLALKT